MTEKELLEWLGKEDSSAYGECHGEQLDALMEAVATEARKHAATAREQLMIRLRAEITAVNPLLITRV